VFTPYSTLRPFFPAARPVWIIDELDQERVMSYELYEKMYWNVPETFKLVSRGTEDKPIYVPSGKIIVETTNRYTAPQLSFSVTPLPGFAVGGDALEQAHAFFDGFLTRERFRAKFAGNKRMGLIRGDWLWHVVADPSKPPGSRVSVHSLDPATYFPIWHPDDLDRILGCHIVEQFVPPDKTDPVIKRTTYRKSDADLKSPPGGPVTYEVATFELDGWGGPDAEKIQQLVPLTALPVTVLPVYHVKNFDEPANPFGSSEMRGLERIVAAVNQGISDEELTLALEGLGMYATDAPPPTDDEGNEEDWILGPGRVVEHPAGSKFIRIDGVGSVTPYQDHLSYLGTMLDQASATPAIAKGNVDVSVAASGIALYMHLSPLLAKTDEKDLAIREVHAQLFHDLITQWFPAYEGLNFEGMQIAPIFGDKIPVDREKRFGELNDMLDRKVISAAYYRAEAAKLGYVFPESIGADVVQEQAALAEAQDPFGARVNEELSGGDDSGEQGAPAPVLNGSGSPGR
jgi:hypothetical protein